MLAGSRLCGLLPDCVGKCLHTAHHNTPRLKGDTAECVDYQVIAINKLHSHHWL